MKKIFGKINEFRKKHKKLFIFIIVLIVLLILFLFIRAKVKEASAAMAELLGGSETAVIERRSLVESLSATGTVVSIDSRDVIADVTGVEVLEIPVSVGDYVKEGDVLCLLDSTDIMTQLSDAQTTLDVTDQKADANVASAGRGLSEAKMDEGVQIYRDYEDADSYYQDYQDALAELDKAQREYDSAKEFYTYRAKEYDDYRAEHEELDEFDFLNKTERGSYYKNNMTSAESDMKSKESTLKSKQDAADAALDKYNSLIRSYEDHVRNGDSTIMTRNDSYKNAQLDSKTASLSTKQQVDKYTDQVEACTVKAPFNGIITSIAVNEGALYNGTTIVTIEDDSAYDITAEIDEYDIAKVKVGQKVVIKTNGTGDTTLDGTVKEIAPRATKLQTNASGAAVSTNVTYKIKITIDTPCDDLKMDMTAKLSIILDEKDGVLTVPYDAVQTDEEGEFFIEVLENATPVSTASKINQKTGVTEIDYKTVDTNNKGEMPVNRKIYVTKGIASDFYIEVIGDEVKEGLEVVVPKTSDGMNELMELMMDRGAMGGF